MAQPHQPQPRATATIRRLGGRAALALALAALLFVTLNLFAYAAFKGWRLDLTQHHIYTLNPATRAVIGLIHEPITLKLYYSEALGRAAPAYAAYAARVRELLEEYTAAADGRIVLEIYDPKPFTEEEDRAVAYGLVGVPVTPGTDERVYFGLVGTNTIDDEKTIPFFQNDRESELEYDLTKVVYALATPNKTRIGIVSTLPLAGGPNPDMSGMQPPWTIHSRLSELFDVKMLGLGDTRIDPALSALLLIQPRDLTPAQLYAVDQYVMGGGRVIAFIDPNSEAEAIRRPPQEMFGSHASSLGALAASWGVDLVPETVVGDRKLAIRVNAPGARGAPIEYVAWLHLGPSGMPAHDRITGQLSQINVATAGILQRRDGATTALTPLLVSEPDAMRIPVAQVSMNPDPRRLLASYRPGGEALTIAARVQGPAASAFPDGPPEGVQNEHHLAQAVRPVDLVVVADTDLLDDRFWADARDFGGERVVTAFANNGDFVVNAIETLTGAIDLSGLRGRAVANHPFERIQALEARADEQFRATEQSLLDQLRQTQTQLQQLQQGEGGRPGVLVSDEQRQAFDTLRVRMVEVRRQLRDVQRALREDVERLENGLRFINIALVPIAVAVLALVLAWLRAARRRRSTSV